MEGAFRDGRQGSGQTTAVYSACSTPSLPDDSTAGTPGQDKMKSIAMKERSQLTITTDQLRTNTKILRETTERLEAKEKDCAQVRQHAVAHPYVSGCLECLC